MDSFVEQVTTAIGCRDGDAIDFALGYSGQFPEGSINSLPLELLHALLLAPGHHMHQPVAREVQRRSDPNSLPIVKQVLDQGFSLYSYTCSDDAVIAKWFGHILADIGTPEAVNAIRTYAASKNEGIALEMQYRLKKIGALGA